MDQARSFFLQNPDALLTAAARAKMDLSTIATYGPPEDVVANVYAAASHDLDALAHEISIRVDMESWPITESAMNPALVFDTSGLWPNFYGDERLSALHSDMVASFLGRPNALRQAAELAGIDSTAINWSAKVPEIVTELLHLSITSGLTSALHKHAIDVSNRRGPGENAPRMPAPLAITDAMLAAASEFPLKRTRPALQELQARLAVFFNGRVDELKIAAQQAGGDPILLAELPGDSDMATYEVLGILASAGACVRFIQGLLQPSSATNQQETAAKAFAAELRPTTALVTQATGHGAGPQALQFQFRDKL